MRESTGDAPPAVAEPNVALVGTLTLDHVAVLAAGEKLTPNGSARVERHFMRPGGIANVAAALRWAGYAGGLSAHAVVGFDRDVEQIFQALATEQVLPDLALGGQPTTRATLVLSPAGQKTSLVQWGACQELTTAELPRATQWVHIAYLDALPELTAETIGRWRRDCPDTVFSADLCGKDRSIEGLRRIWRLLPQIDWLLGDGDTLDGLRKAAAGTDLAFQCPPRQGFVEHFPTGAYLHREAFRSWAYPAPSLEGPKYVLGAGDAFAAGFINAQLEGKTSEDSIVAAHTNAQAWIRRL